MTTFGCRIAEHQRLLRKRGFPMAAENLPPVGQAAEWHVDAIQHLPPSGRHVARQLARLSRDDSAVTIPWRSLADAVGKTDRSGRLMAYTERGVAALVESGWLRVETIGRGCGARTTFYLLPGDRLDYAPWWLDGDEDDLEEWAA